jgi:predicted amidophosphoribosyltransferase
MSIQTITQMNREISAQQTHCYTCGKPLSRIRYECPICQELTCSDECRRKHIETMDSI